METVEQTTGERLRGMRIRAGLTLKQLADKVGYDPASLSRIERNETRATVEIVDAYFKHTAGIDRAMGTLWDILDPMTDPAKAADQALNEARAALDRFLADLPLNGELQ